MIVLETIAERCTSSSLVSGTIKLKYGELSSAIGGAAGLENQRSLNRLRVGSSTLRSIINTLVVE